MAERARHISIWDRGIMWQAVIASFTKLDPRVQFRNPVMFIVEVGSLLTTIVVVQELQAGSGHPLFTGQVAFWLWFTVLFANFAEAMAEGRGKAQAATLRKAKAETMAVRLRDGKSETVPASDLRSGDIVRVEAGQMIPGDGEIIEGVASVDESAITGESAPVIRESGGDRSAVTGGTRVLSDWIVVRITSNPGETFLDRMIALVEGAERQKTPNEIALNILLAVLTLVFLLVVVTLEPFARYAGTSIPIPVLIALLVCLIPTTIGALISSIGIAGMDRLVQHNVLAMSGRSVEAAGDIDTLLLDKTGTITLGNRQATEFRPVAGTSEAALADADSSPLSRTKRQKAARSSCWPRNGTAFVVVSLPLVRRPSSRSRPRRGCPASTWMAGGFGRAPSTLSRASCGSMAMPFPPSSEGTSTGSRATAAPRSW
jgi:potassium-transporting ATPase ATP-binding subunit